MGVALTPDVTNSPTQNIDARTVSASTLLSWYPCTNQTKTGSRTVQAAHARAKRQHRTNEDADPATFHVKHSMRCAEQPRSIIAASLVGLVSESASLFVESSGIPQDDCTSSSTRHMTPVKHVPIWGCIAPV